MPGEITARKVGSGGGGVERSLVKERGRILEGEAHGKVEGMKEKEITGKKTD